MFLLFLEAADGVYMHVVVYARTMYIQLFTYLCILLEVLLTCLKLSNKQYAIQSSWLQ